ncbi:unnamed protein product [Leptidea sinapis]|uniref:Glucuronosyltransferase n=1 Tax=Leptidea sinapis TaxID=189913 RepID=A0A5E4QR97_9NEOP|nr:unnamed protein product [Leptidea sinapis]
MHELAKRGHNVVVITPDPAFPRGQAPENLTEIDVHDVSYANVENLVSSYRGRKEYFYLQFKTFLEEISKIMEVQLQVPAVAKILRQEKNKFDLIFIEACSRTAPGFSHALSAPMIQISSLGVSPAHYFLVGAPIQPFLYPTVIQQRVHNLTLSEKIYAVFLLVKMTFLIFLTEKKDHDLAKKYFGEDLPGFEDLLLNNNQMLFINEHPLWAGNRPVSSNVLYIGGLHQTVDKPLPEDLRAYLDAAKNGVIYISFGTNVMPSMLDPKKIEIIVNVLSQTSFDVLWKWDGDLPGQSENIRTSKWLPQSDLLRGLQSTDEAINAAVPLLGIPLIADQWYNVEKYVYHKIGEYIDFESMDEDILRNTIEAITTNQKQDNILNLRAVMRQYPKKPLELAVWWTEHIIKYGGDHLRPPSAGKWFLEYYEIELVLSVLSLLIILIFVLCSIIFLLFFYIKRYVKVKLQNKNKEE